MERSGPSRQGERVVEASDVVRAPAPTGAATAELTRLLGVHARLGDAQRAVVLRSAGEGRVDVLALWPESTPVEPADAGGSWVSRAGDLMGGVVRSGRTAVTDDEGGRTLVIVSLAPVGETRAVAAFVLEGVPDVGRAAARLELGAAVIGLHSLRMDLARRDVRAGLLAGAVEIGAELGAERRFGAAAMAVANAVAARFDADRVSVGMMGGAGTGARDGFVRVRAISHTERVHRKMDLVGTIEAAMQECADQDEEVAHPRTDNAEQPGVVDRAARELSEREGAVAVLSLPLRDTQGVVGVLTVERGGPHDRRAFTGEETEALRLIGNVVGPRLAELEERDRWVGARTALWARRALARALGPEHTWAKAAAIAAAAFLAFAILGRATETARGGFSIQAVGKRVVAAPFDGFVQDVMVEVGDPVVGGQTILAQLDDSALRLQLVEARAHVRALRQSASAARGRGRIAEAQIAEAQVEEAEAGIHLLEDRIAQASLIAPADGLVIAGAERSVVGAPVETGQALFEIARPGSMRVQIGIPEDRVADLEIGQRGWIAPAAYPEHRIAFEVQRIEPVARVVEGANVFRVYGTLEDTPDWLRPGMEGIARIETGRASYARMWTRELVEWVRMRVWF